MDKLLKNLGWSTSLSRTYANVIHVSATDVSKKSMH